MVVVVALLALDPVAQGLPVPLLQQGASHTHHLGLEVVPLHRLLDHHLVGAQVFEQHVQRLVLVDVHLTQGHHAFLVVALAHANVIDVQRLLHTEHAAIDAVICLLQLEHGLHVGHGVKHLDRGAVLLLDLVEPLLEARQRDRLHVQHHELALRSDAGDDDVAQHTHVSADDGGYEVADFALHPDGLQVLLRQARHVVLCRQPQ